MSWQRREKFWYRCGHIISTLVTTLFLRPKIIGKENIPKVGSIIIAPNHRSMLDIPVLGCTTFRPLRFMAKKGLFKNRIVGWYLENSGSFSVDRNNSDPVAIKRAIRYLKTGSAVVVFPEGKRSKGQGIEELTKGVGFLAVKSKSPVLPVGISGLDKPISWLGPIPRFTRAKVVIGAPIVSHLNQAGKTSEVANQLQTELASALKHNYSKAKNL